MGVVNEVQWMRCLMRSKRKMVVSCYVLGSIRVEYQMDRFTGKS